jgi:PAS domain S-box-containing protein
MEASFSFLRDKSGKPVQILAVTRDISDRKQAEKALQDSESNYRSVIENIQDVFYRSDEQGRLLMGSPSGAKMFGYDSIEEMIGLPLDHFWPDPQERQELLAIVKEKGIARDFEAVLRRKDGSEFNAVFTTHFYYDEHGQLLGTEGFIRDITDKKKAEEEKQKLENRLIHAQKMESIGTLAGGIAHDFNNLLMGIQGRTSLMLADMDSYHANYEHLNEIVAYVRSASDLTRQLLAFARGGKYEVKPTDINKLLSKSSDMFGRTKKEVIIHRKSQKNIWTTEVDRSQIEQVLLNLFVNAWQSMPGGGELYLETENVGLDAEAVRPYSVEPGNYVKITVTDTGVGMDTQTQERIFDPFFTTKEMGRGTGLGLASAYGIVKNHNGFITVDSEKGKGATLKIFLPSVEKEIEEEIAFSETVLTGRETVLLVDDEPMIIDVAKEMLKKIGYEVLVATSAKSAIELYKTHQEEIDLVILDMVMPDMGGGETYSILKEIDPDVKVLLSIGYSINGEATKILERGCDGFIQKPFTMVDFSQKIRGVLELNTKFQTLQPRKR